MKKRLQEAAQRCFELDPPTPNGWGLGWWGSFEVTPSRGQMEACMARLTSVDLKRAVGTVDKEESIWFLLFVSEAQA